MKKKLPRLKTERVHHETQNSGFMSDALAGPLSDYVRQYIGVAMPEASNSSGVLRNLDRVASTQSFMELVGFDMYDEIENDDEVASAYQVRKFDIAGVPWRIVPASESQRDKKVAEFVKTTLHELDMTQPIVDLMDAVGKGFSVSEIVWGLNKKNQIVPKELCNRPQRRFQFDATTRVLKLRTLTSPLYGEVLPDKKFIVHRNSTKYTNVFGDPLDQKVYWLWLFKRNVMRFWMQYAETSAAPIPIVKHRRGNSDKLKTEAMEIAKSIRNGSYGHMPMDMDIVYAEMRNIASTADSYSRFIELCNTQIAKLINGQTLTSDGNSKGKGTLALGKVHRDTKNDVLEYDGKCLAVTFNKQLIPWMVDFNFAGADYPKLAFGAEDKIDVEAFVTNVKTLADGNYRADRDFVQETSGIKLESAEQAVKSAQDAIKAQQTAPGVEPNSKTKKQIKSTTPKDGAKNE